SHFDLAEDLFASFHEFYPGACDIAFINFGTQTPPPGIGGRATMQVAMPPPPEFSKRFGYYAAYSGAKARLPMIFPGYQLYVWIDSDCWFQGADSLPRIIAQAQKHEIAIHPEFDIHYLNYPTPSKRTATIYARNEADNLTSMPLDKPMLNAGVIALRHNSRVWALWQQELAMLHVKFQQGQNIYFSDQIPLHKLIYLNNIDIGTLRATDNWQTYACLPLANLTKKKLVLPTPPHEEIGIIHLAGKTKYQMMHMNGHSFGLRYRDFQKLAREVF
ncbi:MAG TPA: hypothetical protein PLT25_07580, partial [Acidocella sp.]|nr:hypothetical protein [Acidocella sp.]